jgi:hypothetical protein
MKANLGCFVIIGADGEPTVASGLYSDKPLEKRKARGRPMHRAVLTAGQERRWRQFGTQAAVAEAGRGTRRPAPRHPGDQSRVQSGDRARLPDLRHRGLARALQRPGAGHDTARAQHPRSTSPTIPKTRRIR